MGKKRREKRSPYTLPPSPTHSSSSSSSDFEFIICQSKPPNPYSSADELFYKGLLLPLHLSHRLSMVQTLISASSSSSSSSSTAAASRDSTGSTSSTDSTAASLHPDYFYCDSNRPSSDADDIDGLMKTPLDSGSGPRSNNNNNNNCYVSKKSGKYGFSLARFSSVFKNKEHKNGAEKQAGNDRPPPSSVKRMSSTAREVIHKYLKKVKPLYEKLSKTTKNEETCPKQGTGTGSRGFSITFSGNLRYQMRKKRCAASCPSSMRSSPNHSGVLYGSSRSRSTAETSSMEELQNAIQGAIAHCKSSMSQNKTILVGQ